MNIKLTIPELNQYNSLLGSLVYRPAGKFYLRDLIVNQPCSPRVGRAFYEHLSNGVLQNVIVSNLHGNGAVEYEKI